MRSSRATLILPSPVATWVLYTRYRMYGLVLRRDSFTLGHSLGAHTMLRFYVDISAF
jgi:hypothetical protein